MICRLYIIFIVLATSVLAQQASVQLKTIPSTEEPADSLIHLLQNNPGSRHNIERYLRYGKKFEQSAPDSAWFYYEKARRLAQRLNDKRGMSRYITHALILVNNKGNYERGLSMGRKMVAIGRQLKDTTILIRGYNDIANEYEYLGALQQASDQYITALRLADKRGNPKLQQKLNNNIASVFIELKDYNRGNLYAASAYGMARTNRDTAAMGSSLINLGLTEIHLKKEDQALKHFNQTIRIGRQVHDATLVADARLDKGVIYTKQNKLRQARREYEQVRTMAAKLKMPYYSLYALFSLGVVDQQQHNYPQAAKLAGQAIAIGERLGAAGELSEMYDTLSVVLEKMGDLNGALTYRKKHETLSDSLRSARVKTNINRLQIQYKAAQKDKQIAEQNLKLQKSQLTIERKNNWLFLTVAGLIILLILILLGYRFYRQRQRLQEQTIVNFRKEQEVIQLKAMMQGKDEERRRIAAEIHDDIGSALTTIMYLCDKLSRNGEKEGIQTIGKITTAAGSVVDKMNEIIWSMNREYDTLDDLVTYIRHNAVEFLEDHSKRYQLNIPVEVPSIPLDGEKRRNIYLIVKEALHNIIKHAEATEVTLDFRIGEELIIHIHDNGKGFDISHPRKFGNGLKNMKARMETIGGQFSVNCERGTSVCISLPLPVAEKEGVDNAETI